MTAITLLAITAGCTVLFAASFPPPTRQEIEAAMGLRSEGDVVRVYKLPWCGRFSVPFGVKLLGDVAEKTGMGTPEGHFLRYATSLSEPMLPVSQKTLDAGLGTTAPSNLHHWVGYATVGFTVGNENE